MKKGLLCLMFLLLVVNVSALSVEKNALNEVIIPDYNIPARIQLEIDGAEAGNYNIYTLTGVSILPFEPVTLKDGYNLVDITVSETESLDFRGYYQFAYNIKQIGGDNFEDVMIVQIRDIEDVLLISSESNDPEGKEIKFFVKNKYDAEIKNIDARFSSVLFSFDEKFSLKPNEVKEFVVPMEKLNEVDAGGYIINMKLNTPSGEREISGKIFLGAKEGIETQIDEDGFFVRTIVINKINVGNVPQDVQVRIEKDFFSRLFTSFNINPSTIDTRGGKSVYTWNKRVGAAEVLNVKAKTNYFTPILLVIFVALIIYGIKKLNQKKILVEKSVSRVKTKNDDFALRVSLRVRALKNVENVSVIDKVPAVVKVYDKFSTLKPDKIDTKNRRLQWNFADLGAGEERVFSYVVYSKIGVLGKFSLPPATVLFEKEGQIHETESNTVYFYHEEKD